MAKALARVDSGASWVKLHDALTRAVANEVIACPASAVVEQEVELSADAKAIIDVVHGLGAVRFVLDPVVGERQLFRALDRYLASKGAELEARPPWQDAFDADPHGWLEPFWLRADLGSPSQWTARRRERKQALRAQFESFFRKYADDHAPFENVLAAEMRGVGEGLLMSPDFFEPLVLRVLGRLRCTPAEARRVAEAFLMSEHPVRTPYGSCQATLYAGMAMACSGPNARLPKAGDYFDVNHIATYVPYVDVMIVDGFFEEMCRKARTQIGATWGTTVRSLRPAEIPEFIDWVEGLVRDSPTAQLAERVHAVLTRDTGEWVDKLKQWMPDSAGDPSDEVAHG